MKERYFVNTFEEIFADLKAKSACFSLKDLAVKGNDVMEFGYRGPEVGRKLRELLDAVIEEKNSERTRSVNAIFEL